MLSFFSHLAFQGDPKPFWVSSSVLVVRRVKATYSILKSLLLEAKKKTLEACQPPQFLHIDRSTDRKLRDRSLLFVTSTSCVITFFDSKSSMTCNRRIPFTSKEKIPWPMLNVLKGILTSAEVLIFFPRKFHQCFWWSNHLFITVWACYGLRQT